MKSEMGFQELSREVVSAVGTTRCGMPGKKKTYGGRDAHHLRRLFGPYCGSRTTCAGPIGLGVEPPSQESEQT